tara:strand:- start:40 stop:591 length:552 start_codon:yes stop_codon:yes gene_type:complete
VYYNDDIFPVEELRFNIEWLQEDLAKVRKDHPFGGDFKNCISLTQIPGAENDPRGLFWIPSIDGEEERERYVDEGMYTLFNPAFEETYFKTVYDRLLTRYELGRVRILKLEPRTCLSYHRDPEPRVHIPLTTNPGALMIVDQFAVNLPTDGRVYFTNTLKYHSVLNGGETERIHLVATVLNEK